MYIAMYILYLVENGVAIDKPLIILPAHGIVANAKLYLVSGWSREHVTARLREHLMEHH